MKKKIIFMASIFLFFIRPIIGNLCDNAAIIQNQQEKRAQDIKILVLIIASDDYPVYVELQKIWRSYMHYDKKHVEAYFIRGNPYLNTPYAVENDVIWAKSPENLIPGLVNKTIASLEALLPRIRSEFDYVLRTNLSSFYIFPRLLEFLKSSQRSGFYAGSDIGVPGIGSGCGFLMSSDIAEFLVHNKNHFYNNMTGNDDEVIGRFLKDRGVPLIPHPRMDFYEIGTWHLLKNHIPENVFHFRIKNLPHLRLIHDIYIHLNLVQLFYK